MNERQKIVLLCGFGIFFAMLVYCPWEIHVEDSATRHIRSEFPGISPIIGTESETIYDWTWQSLQRERLGEHNRKRDSERLRWQIMIWALAVMLVFLRLRTESDPRHVLDPISSTNQT
jgi:hypothetical protein